MIEIKTAQGWRPLFAVCSNSNQLEGVFRATPLSEAQATNSLRADRFCVALDTDQYGPSFRGSHLAEALYGAYGEKL